MQKLDITLECIREGQGEFNETKLIFPALHTRVYGACKGYYKCLDGVFLAFTVIVEKEESRNKTLKQTLSTMGQVLSFSE